MLGHSYVKVARTTHLLCSYKVTVRDTGFAELVQLDTCNRQ